MSQYTRKFYELTEDLNTGEVIGAVFEHVDDVALRDYVKESIQRFTGVQIVNCSGTWWGYSRENGAWVQGRYLEKAVAYYLRGVDIKHAGRAKPDGTIGKSWTTPLEVTRGRVKAVEQMLETGQTDDDFFNSSKGHGVAFTGDDKNRSHAVVVTVEGKKARLSKRWSSPDWRLRNFVHGNYDEKAKTPLFDKFLDEAFNGAPDKQDRIRVIWEWLGVALSGYATALSQALILYGPAGCGKSKLSQILAACWPDTLRSTVTPHQLAEDRFSGSLLKAINTVGEIPSGALNVAEKWKEVVAGDLISIEKKYRDAYPSRPYAAWVMACNTLPAVLDPSDGFTRRVLIVPMQRKFTGTDVDDANVAQNIVATEIPNIVSRALNYALLALSVNRIAGCASGQEILSEWRIGDNAMMAWLNSPGVLKLGVGKPPPGVGEKAGVLFDHYKKFCLATGSEAGSQKKFSMRLRDQGFEPDTRTAGTFYAISIGGGNSANGNLVSVPLTQSSGAEEDVVIIGFRPEDLVTKPTK